MWFAIVPLFGPVTIAGPEPAKGLLLVYWPTPADSSVEIGTTFAAVGMLTIGVCMMSIAEILYVCPVKSDPSPVIWKLVVLPLQFCPANGPLQVVKTELKIKFTSPYVVPLH